MAWQLVYADDLVAMVDTQQNLMLMLKAWKAVMESKGLHVNMKRKFTVSSVGHHVLKKSAKWPCGTCCTGVANNSIQRLQCMVWVHKNFTVTTNGHPPPPPQPTPPKKKNYKKSWPPQILCEWSVMGRPLAHWWQNCWWNRCSQHRASCRG